MPVSLQDVGDGWWEGISPDGSRGLFPEAYVEVKFEDHNFFEIFSFLKSAINYDCSHLKSLLSRIQ